MNKLNLKNKKVRTKYHMEMYHLKYTILRRAICGLTELNKIYTLEELKQLCYEIEGTTLEELKQLHKKYIGY